MLTSTDNPIYTRKTLLLSALVVYTRPGGYDYCVHKITRLVSRQKRESAIINSIMPRRYRFDAIFNVNLPLGIIIPRYTVIINNTRFNKGVAINRDTSFGGLNLFNYIGRDIVGVWDPATRELTITGFN